jgi:RNA polymerase sigma factor for flagellar operon FliA
MTRLDTPAPSAAADGQDTEAALWRAFRADPAGPARERLFTLHAGFARSIAHRHHRDRSFGDLDVEDIRQLAFAGLLEAIDRFDPDRGVPFRGFASHRISGSIRDGLARMSEMREQLSWRQRLRRERVRSLAAENPESLSTADALAALADLAVGLAIGFMLEGTGMVTPAEEGGEQDRAPQVTAYDSAAWKELVGRLQAELGALPEREQAILRHHYVDGIAFEHLAVLLGVSKARVSQLHRAALETLRKRMLKRGHFRLER